MTLFPFIRKKFEILGIILYQSEHHLNKRIWFYSFSYSLSCISYSLFLYYEANTFWEYTNSIYSTTTLFLNVACFIIIIFQTGNLFEFIGNCEKFVHKSQSPASKAIYIGSDREIEKWSKIIHLVVAEITPFLMVLPQCITLLVYLSTDVGTDAFELHLPMW